MKERERRNFVQDSRPLKAIFFLIITHDAEDTQQRNKQVQHVEIQSQRGGDMFVGAVVAQNI